MKINFVFKLLILISLSHRAFALPQCPGYQAGTGEASLATLNPPPHEIDGVKFPGNQQVLYRGITEQNDQFDLEPALRAMFHEENWYLGSPLFVGISRVLTGEWDLDRAFYPDTGLPNALRSYFKERGLLPEVQLLLKCRPDGKFKKTDADAFAADLLNKYFGRIGPQKTAALYLNIASTNYYDSSSTERGYGNKGIEFIVGSTYDQVAALYGKKVLVFRDLRNRGVDLSYWNQRHNGKFWDSWVDSGEVDMPSYLRSDEVIGYLTRTVDRDHGRSLDQGLPPGEIDIAYYKLDIGNERVVVVVDGNSEKCAIQGSDHRVYACNQDNWENLTTKPVGYPSPRSEKGTDRLPLLGVISTCANDACPAVKRVIKKYGKFSDREMTPELIAQIAAIKTGGKRLRFTGRSAAISDPSVPPAPVDTSTPDSTASGIKIVSATFLTPAQIAKGKKGNVTAAAAEYCNGKSSVKYKVSAKYLQIEGDGGDPVSKREFRIRWYCTEKPKAVRELKVEAPAEGKFINLECNG